MSTHTTTSRWFTSSYSNAAQDCVEVRFDGGLDGGAVHVRDSKQQGTGPVITVASGGWAGFLAATTRTVGQSN